MTTLDELRKMFAESMLENCNKRFSFDTALFKVCDKVYKDGYEDGFNAQLLGTQQNKKAV